MKKLDAADKPWVITSVLVILISTAAFLPYAYGHQQPSGGSRLGLLFGIVGFAMLAFSTSLAIRKRFPRLLPAGFWVRGHLYAGATCLPLLLFHSYGSNGENRSFSLGGPLTSLLIILLLLVIICGVVGRRLQRRLPSYLLTSVPRDGGYERDCRALAKCHGEAREIILKATGEALKAFYQTHVERFLGAGEAGLLSTAETAEGAFVALDKKIDAPDRPISARLRCLVRESQELRRRTRLYRISYLVFKAHRLLSFLLLGIALLHGLVSLMFI